MGVSSSGSQSKSISLSEILHDVLQPIKILSPTSDPEIFLTSNYCDCLLHLGKLLTLIESSVPLHTSLATKKKDSSKYYAESIDKSIKILSHSLSILYLVPTATSEKRFLVYQYAIDIFDSALNVIDQTIKLFLSDEVVFSFKTELLNKTHCLYSNCLKMLPLPSFNCLTLPNASDSNTLSNFSETVSKGEKYQNEPGVPIISVENSDIDLKSTLVRISELEKIYFSVPSLNEQFKQICKVIKSDAIYFAVMRSKKLQFVCLLCNSTLLASEVELHIGSLQHISQKCKLRRNEIGYRAFLNASFNIAQENIRCANSSDQTFDADSNLVSIPVPDEITFSVGIHEQRFKEIFRNILDEEKYFTPVKDAGKLILHCSLCDMTLCSSRVEVHVSDFIHLQKKKCEPVMSSSCKIPVFSPNTAPLKSPVSCPNSDSPSNLSENPALSSPSEDSLTASFSPDCKPAADDRNITVNSKFSGSVPEFSSPSNLAEEPAFNFTSSEQKNSSPAVNSHEFSSNPLNDGSPNVKLKSFKSDLSSNQKLLLNLTATITDQESSLHSINSPNSSINHEIFEATLKSSVDESDRPSNRLENPLLNLSKISNEQENSLLLKNSSESVSNEKSLTVVPKCPDSTMSSNSPPNSLSRPFLNLSKIANEQESLLCSGGCPDSSFASKFKPILNEENFSWWSNSHQKQFEDVCKIVGIQINYFSVKQSDELKLTCMLCNRGVTASSIVKHIGQQIHLMNIIKMNNPSSLLKLFIDRRKELTKTNKRFLVYFCATGDFVCSLCNMVLTVSEDRRLEHFKSEYHLARLHGISQGSCTETSSDSQSVSENMRADEKENNDQLNSTNCSKVKTANTSENRPYSFVFSKQEDISLPDFPSPTPNNCSNRQLIHCTQEENSVQVQNKSLRDNSCTILKIENISLPRSSSVATQDCSLRKVPQLRSNIHENESLKVHEQSGNQVENYLKGMKIIDIPLPCPFSTPTLDHEKFNLQQKNVKKWEDLYNHADHANANSSSPEASSATSNTDHKKNNQDTLKSNLSVNYEVVNKTNTAIEDSFPRYENIAASQKEKSLSILKEAVTVNENNPTSPADNESETNWSTINSSLWSDYKNSLDRQSLQNLPKHMYNLMTLKFANFTHGTQFVKLIKNINDQVSHFLYESKPELGSLIFICRLCDKSFMINVDTAIAHVKTWYHRQNLALLSSKAFDILAIKECPWMFLEPQTTAKSYLCKCCKVQLPNEFFAWIDHFQSRLHSEKFEQLPTFRSKKSEVNSNEIPVIIKNVPTSAENYSDNSNASEDLAQIPQIFTLASTSNFEQQTEFTDESRQPLPFPLKNILHFKFLQSLKDYIEKLEALITELNFQVALFLVDCNTFDMKSVKVICRLCAVSLNISEVMPHVESNCHSKSMISPFVSKENMALLDWCGVRRNYSCLSCKVILPRGVCLFDHFESVAHILRSKKADESSVKSEEITPNDEQPSTSLVRLNCSIKTSAHTDLSGENCALSNIQETKFCCPPYIHQSLQLASNIEGQINLLSFETWEQNLSIVCRLRKVSFTEVEQVTRYFKEKNHGINIDKNDNKTTVIPQIPGVCDKSRKFLWPITGTQNYFCILCCKVLANEVLEWVDHFQSKSHYQNIKELHRDLLTSETCSPINGVKDKEWALGALAPDNLFHDSFDFEELCFLSLTHKAQYENMAKEISYQINWFSVHSDQQSKDLKLACKICDCNEKVGLNEVKEHIDGDDHLGSLVAKCKLGPITNVSEISVEDWQFLDFNEDSQDYFCVLCDVILPDSQKSWTDHFQNCVHLEKVKKQQTVQTSTFDVCNDVSSSHGSEIFSGCTTTCEASAAS